MAETDGADVTFYSATDQIANRKTKKQPTLDGRREAERLAYESDSVVPVAAAKKAPTGALKITSRNGKSVSAAKSAKKPEMAASEMPGQDEARRQALELLVRERAKLMAAQNTQKKK